MRAVHINAVILVAVLLVQVLGVSIAWSDFVPSPIATTAAVIVTLVVVVLAAVWAIGIGPFGLFQGLTQFKPGLNIPRRGWRVAFWAPLLAFGISNFSLQAFGNVIPWTYTKWLGADGQIMVIVDGSDSHYYANPLCTYPTLQGIPNAMIGHRALCEVGADRGATLRLSGRRTALGICVAQVDVTRRLLTTRWSERGKDKLPASITQQRVAQRGR